MVKCLQVYFILSQDNFILVDVISMWDMSFVFKKAWTYGLDHYSYTAIRVNQKSYNNIQSEVVYEMFHILNCGFEIKWAMIIAVMNAI